MSESRTFPIGLELARQYRGPGVALAAVRDGAVVRLVYFSDIVPEFDGSVGDVLRWLDDERVGGAIDELKQLGAVVLGKAASWRLTTIASA